MRWNTVVYLSLVHFLHLVIIADIIMMMSSPLHCFVVAFVPAMIVCGYTGADTQVGGSRSESQTDGQRTGDPQ